MVTQPPKDTPFGLEPNVAAGLAYLLALVGGIVMLVGGGTNKFVKWAACQSIALFCVYLVVYIAAFIVDLLLGMLHMYPLIGLVGIVMMLAGILYFAAWLWTTIYAFQGKEVQLPFVAGLTHQFFGSQLN